MPVVQLNANAHSSAHHPHPYSRSYSATVGAKAQHTKTQLGLDQDQHDDGRAFFAFNSADNFVFADVLSPRTTPVSLFPFPSSSAGLPIAYNNNNDKDQTPSPVLSLSSSFSSSGEEADGSTFTASPETYPVGLDRDWTEYLNTPEDEDEREDGMSGLEGNVDGAHVQGQGQGQGQEWDWVSDHLDLSSAFPLNVAPTYEQDDDESWYQDGPIAHALPLHPHPHLLAPAPDTDDNVYDPAQLSNFAQGIPSLPILPRGSSGSSAAFVSPITTTGLGRQSAYPSPANSHASLSSASSSSMISSLTSSRNSTSTSNHPSNIPLTFPSAPTVGRNTIVNLSSSPASASDSTFSQGMSEAQILASRLTQDELLDMLARLQREQFVDAQVRAHALVQAQAQAQARADADVQAQRQFQLQQQLQRFDGMSPFQSRASSIPEGPTTVDDQTLDFATMLQRAGIPSFADMREQRRAGAEQSVGKLEKASIGSSLVEDDDEDEDEESDEEDDAADMAQGTARRPSSPSSSAGSSTTTTTGRASSSKTTANPNTKRGRKPSPKDVLNAPNPTAARVASIKLERRRSINRRSARTLREKRKSELQEANDRADGFEARLKEMEEELKVEREWRRKVEGLLSKKVNNGSGLVVIV